MIIQVDLIGITVYYLYLKNLYANVVSLTLLKISARDKFVARNY